MKSFLFSFAALTLLSTAACNRNDDDTPEPEEQELITTLQMILTPQGGGTTDTVIYKVQNGFGSTAPGIIQIDTMVLRAGTTYDARMRVLNESETPAEDITTEIESEKDDHLFLFSSDPATGAGAVAVTGGNKDNQGLPYNLKVQITPVVHAVGNSQLTVTLLHEPTNKSATTVAAAGGETDLEAVFPVRITN